MQNIKYEAQEVSLPLTIEIVIKNYLDSIGKDKVTNLYDMVLEQIEPSLLETIMKYCRYNQSKAADVLGLSRGTLRAKLIKYFGDQYCGHRDE